MHFYRESTKDRTTVLSIFPFFLVFVLSFLVPLLYLSISQTAKAHAAEK